jgi:aminopeptidase N
VTTHPIEMPVRDTKSGDASFDAITYSKGASALKQLNHFLGEDAFRGGVREYMNRFAWQAATLPNFIDTLGEVSNRDMGQWSSQWLETAGTNTVKASFECVDEKVSGFTLQQTAPSYYPTIRQHRLKVGLFGLVDEAITPQRTVSIEWEGPLTSVPAMVGEPCPVLVYPNVDDWAFVRVLLDDNSLVRAPGLLEKIEDPLLRGMFWQSLWDAVLDQDAPLSVYLDLALHQLPGEEHSALLQQLLGRFRSAKNLLYLFGDNASGLRERYLPAMESMAWAQVESSESGSDSQKLWFDTWLDLAKSEQALSRIEQWLNGASEPLNLHEDQDRRWEALGQLAVQGYAGLGVLLKAEQQRDPSYIGSLYLLAVTASQPDPAIKSAYLDLIEDSASGKMSMQLKASMRWMFLAGQEDLLEQYAERILSFLPEMDSSRDQDLVSAYSRSLLPALCTPESVQRLARAIADRGALGLGATKSLRITHQEDQRCVDMAARQLAGFGAQ